MPVVVVESPAKAKTINKYLGSKYKGLASFGHIRDLAHRGLGVLVITHDLNLAARWCDHLLLLFPDGEACWGPAEQMLVPSVLERLYNQKLTTVEADGAPVFVPLRG